MQQTGVLVIAHGSKNKKWVEYIDHTVAVVPIHLPIIVGFLEMVEGRSIEESVRKLEQKNVKRIIVIPLFISSGSTHLEEIQYVLGVKKHSRIETDLKQIHPEAEVAWSAAMDDHPYMIDILTHRIHALSTKPTNESLLLVAHGSEAEGFQHIWEDTLTHLTQTLQAQFQFNKSWYATLLPDNLTDRAELLSNSNKLVVIPVFLSEGYFTTKVIPKKLSGLSYAYNGETYLPHPLVSRWIEEQILKIWRHSYEYVG